MGNIKFIVISLLFIITKQEEISSSHNAIDAGEYEVICDHCQLLGDEEKFNVSEILEYNIRNIDEESNSTTDNSNGTCGSSADDFPNFFTQEQRKQGAIVIHIVVVIYCFILVAIICDSYFIPCVEQIATSLNLSEDVAAATFMSIATSAPELFVNVIGTFITKSDIGIGTIVGSSMFNTLGVASVGGLAASVPIQLAWWPLCRDITMYIIAVSALVVITWDGIIFWYEAMCLFAGYFLYFTVMFQNNRISKRVYAFVGKFQKPKPLIEGHQQEKSLKPVYRISIEPPDQPRSHYAEAPRVSNDQQVTLTITIEENLFKPPKGGMFNKFYFFYTWPLRFALYWTVPDSRKFPRLFPVTFVMCVVWIGCNSYVTSWLVSIIGYTFGIPDAVLGLTILGAVGCLGEAFSIGIMSRKGEGKMGVSNALGANTMNILLSLGMPWFIQTMVLGADSDATVHIESGSMEYTILGLIVVSITLFVTLAINKFKMSRVTGTITLILYLCFISLAIVSDMVFFPRECS